MHDRADVAEMRDIVVGDESPAELLRAGPNVAFPVGDRGIVRLEVGLHVYTEEGDKRAINDPAVANNDDRLSLVCGGDAEQRHPDAEEELRPALATGSEWSGGDAI